MPETQPRTNPNPKHADQKEKPKELPYQPWTTFKEIALARSWDNILKDMTINNVQSTTLFGIALRALSQQNGKNIIRKTNIP